MLTSLPLLAYLMLASVSLCVLALALYLEDRSSPELRSSARLMGAMGVLVLVLAVVGWMGRSGALLPAPPVPFRLDAEHVTDGVKGHQ